MGLYSLCLSSSSLPISLKPPVLRSLPFASQATFLKPTYYNKKRPNERKAKNLVCRAEWSQDAPFAAAIGACILNSLVFPVASTRDDDDNDSVIDSTDARYAVMGIISFIPYFNWLSWVFAWLDTSEKRYAVYAIVYLAPYLRDRNREFEAILDLFLAATVLWGWYTWSNLSLSPEESWLPLTSIIFCIIHIQLEASIRNGDLQGFQLFSKTSEHLSSMTKKRESKLKEHQGMSEEGRKRKRINLPSAEEQSIDEISKWGVPKMPSRDAEPLNEDGDVDKGRKH